MKKLIFFISIFIFFPFYVFSNEIFLSLKKDKVNVRYGPGFEYPIKYIYKKIDLPIKQIDKKENFRRIIDFKNNSGWIHISQLKKNNSVIAKKNKILFKKPSTFAKPIALIKEGRLLILEKCEKMWCEVFSNDYQGWIKKENLWGIK